MGKEKIKLNSKKLPEYWKFVEPFLNNGVHNIHMTSERYRELYAMFADIEDFIIKEYLSGKI